MGVDFFNCEICNEIFDDCGSYGNCDECEAFFCPPCREKYEDENSRRINKITCPICRAEIITDVILLVHALELLDIDKDTLIESCIKTKIH